MRGLAALLLMTGSLSAVVGAGRIWLAVQVQDPVLGRTEVLVTGSSVTGAVTAAGLLGAAAGLVSVLTRGVARGTGLVLALAAGGWLVWIGTRVAVAPLTAARSSELTGAVGSPGSAPVPGSLTGAGAVNDADPTAWPLLVALTGLLVVGGAVTGLVAQRRASTSRAPTAAVSKGTAGSKPKTQRPATAEPQELQRRRAARAWDELSAGHDPTDDQHPDPDVPPRESGARPRDS